MNDSTRKESSGNQSNLPAPVSKPDNLLDAALAHLPAEQRQALVQKAVESKLEIDVQAKKADLRHQASSADMANTIDHVRSLESTTKSDYTVKAEYETASGRTSVEVKKSNSAVTVIIAIGIVIGIVVLFLLARGK